MPDYYAEIHFDGLAFRFQPREPPALTRMDFIGDAPVAEPPAMYVAAGDKDRDRWFVGGRLDQGSAEWPPSLETLGEFLQVAYPEEPDQLVLARQVQIFGVSWETVAAGPTPVFETQRQSWEVLKQNAGKLLKLIDPGDLEEMANAFGASIEERVYRHQMHAKAEWN